MNSAAIAEIKIVRIVLWMVLLLYLLILTKMIVFKASPGYIKQHFAHNYNWQRIKQHAKEGNYTPFTTIKLYLHSRGRIEYSIANLAGNVVGFMPLGLLMPVLYKRLRSAWKMILLSFFVSLAFETVQLVTILGSFDVDDLILNTLGGLLGYCVFMIFFYNVAKASKGGHLHGYQEIPAKSDI